MDFVSIANNLFGSIQIAWQDVHNEEDQKRILLLMLKTELKFNLDLLSLIKKANTTKPSNESYLYIAKRLQNDVIKSILFYQSGQHRTITHAMIDKFISLSRPHSKRYKHISENSNVLMQIYQKINVLKAIEDIHSNSPELLNNIRLDVRLSNIKSNILYLVKELNLNLENVKNSM